MVFNRLSETYRQIEEISRRYESPVEKYLELSFFLKENQAALLQDLLANREHISLFRKIEQFHFNGPADAIKSVRNTCALLQLKALIKGSDGEKLGAWVLKNKDGISVANGLELFADLSKARQMLVERHQLMPNISAALSDIVTVGLGLKGVKEIQTVGAKYPQQTEILVHWINSEKIPLAKLQLSNAELATIAPHLHYVNCIDLKLNDVKQFIQSCSNAHHLIIKDPTIKTLDHLPQDLQILDCSYCEELRNLDISSNRALKELYLSWCGRLEALNLSNNLELKSVWCPGSRSLSILDLSKNHQLTNLVCGGCVRLTSLGPSLSNKLISLTCSDCSCLTQLPQLSPKTRVYSERSPCGPIHHFKVSPKDLEEKPRQVLLNLSQILLNNKPMPNIVYIDSKQGQPLNDRDPSSLRKHFVATLCKNLFKEGSHFTSIEFGNTYIPTLRHLENLDALRTFARLLGVAATTSTPIQVPLYLNFFQGVFHQKNYNLAGASIEELLPTKELEARLQKEPNAQLITRALGIDAATLVVAKELQAYFGAERFKEFGDNIDTFMAKIQGTRSDL